MLPWPGPLELKVTFGRYLRTSSKVVTFNWASCSPVIAWMVMGTFWMDSVRRCAVTTISSMPPAASVSPDAAALAAQAFLVPAEYGRDRKA